MSIPAKIPPGTRFFAVFSLVLCGALALAFAIVMPPLQVPDEHGHFVRAYMISRGQFVAQGIPVLPAPVAAFVMRYPEFLYDKFDAKEIVRDISAHTTIPPTANTTLTNSDGHHEYLVSGIVATNIYCPVVYLPASLGIWIARTLHTSPLVMMYAARVFNVLTFIAALAISFRLAPAYRALIAAVALLPMTLHQAAAISGDLVTIALSFVALSLVLHSRENQVTHGFLILVALVFVLLGLSKSSIWALPVLWLIPASAFKHRRAWFVYVGTVTICTLGALLIWNAIISSNMPALRAVRLAVGIDVAANVRLVTARPFAFAIHLLGKVVSNLKGEMGQLIGAFGWDMFSLPLWVRSLYLLLLLSVAVLERSPKPFLGWERAVLLLVFLGGTLFIHAAMAISDSTLCAGNLGRCSVLYDPVQGRYFLPFCLAGFLILRQNWKNLTQTTLLAAVTVAGTLHALAALVLIRSTLYL
jgi:uncharacterized membrane protein